MNMWRTVMMIAIDDDSSRMAVEMRCWCRLILLLARRSSGHSSSMREMHQLVVLNVPLLNPKLTVLTSPEGPGVVTSL